MNIYVANIPFKASEQELKGLFEEYGEVSSAKIIMDKVTQRSRGFGCVEMADESAGRQAISSLNGYNFLGKTLVVNEARPRTDAPRGGGGGFRSGGFRSGGYNRSNAIGEHSVQQPLFTFCRDGSHGQVFSSARLTKTQKTFSSPRRFRRRCTAR